jgi:fatty acid-binding protein DegV
VRGERKAIPSILSNMKKMGYKGGKVIIDHCFNENAAKQLKELIRMEFKHADIRIGTTKGLCSFYAEQGGLLIGFES